ncbi:MAG: hypothetical protein LBT80_07565 [Lactobacillaceae bacterium]|jgi:hypothetical protein|nr:hypothetical protein [Lactobacillaceae bacterium]
MTENNLDEYTISDIEFADLKKQYQDAVDNAKIVYSDFKKAKKEMIIWVILAVGTFLGELALVIFSYLRESINIYTMILPVLLILLISGLIWLKRWFAKFSDGPSKFERANTIFLKHLQNEFATAKTTQLLKTEEYLIYYLQKETGATKSKFIVLRRVDNPDNFDSRAQGFKKHFETNPRVRWGLHIFYLDATEIKQQI